MPASPSELEAGFAAALARRWGGQPAVRLAFQPSLGGSNRTLVFDVTHAGQTRRLVSREESFAQSHSPFLTPSQQFHLLQRVHGAGIRAPEPVFAYDSADALGPGYVMAHVAGESLPRRLLADTSQHPQLAAELACELAKLHALGPELGVELAKLPESGDPVAALTARIDALDEPHPALEAGLRWLARNNLPPSGKTLVHGDFRTGNFLAESGRLAALLDWECSHLARPAADIGWFCTRSWRFGRIAQQAGGLATRAEFLRLYAQAGGAAPDLEEVRWWEIFGLIRWAMYNMLQGLGHVHGRRSPAYAACGRNVALMEYDLLMTLRGKYD